MQSCGIDGRQATPALNEHSGGQRTTRKRAELGDRLAVAGYRERFAASHAIEDLTATVAKFPDSNLAHSDIVSPVRPIEKGARQAVGI